MTDTEMKKILESFMKTNEQIKLREMLISLTLRNKEIGKEVLRVIERYEKDPEETCNTFESITGIELVPFLEGFYYENERRKKDDATIKNAKQYSR